MPTLITPIWMLMGGAHGKMGGAPGGIRWLLRDDFTDTRAAGAVNGTLATPTGGARTVTDTNSKISVGSGVLNLATGAANFDGVWYPSQTRTAGRAYIAKVVPADTNSTIRLGWDIDTSASNVADAVAFAAGGAVSVTLNTAVNISVGAYTATTYYAAVVMRATGAHFFIKGGTFTQWTRLYHSVAGSGNLLPAANMGTTTVATIDWIRVPQSLIVLVPLASDAFTRANGALGNTGGGGSEESGGDGKAWTAQKGTWAVATNVAACSALADSVGIATVDVGTTNVMVQAVVTRSAGTAGLCLRYQSATNYIKAVHNGTNFQVIEVVNGTPNTLVNAAATYGATKRTIVSLKGTAVRAYYGDALIGSEATTAIATGTNMGLFTDDTGATFDSFVVWAKGNGGEYESAFNKYITP